MAYDLLLERFLRYVKINTRSDENATRTPTTQSQVDFALNILKPELEELGLSNVHYLESNGYLVATLPANDDKLTRKIGFISHMDTADFNAEGVSPQVIESYDGGIIPLGSSGYNLNRTDFPNLQNYMGHTLFTRDGSTLLGADDKSGIAEIMTAVMIPTRIKFGPEKSRIVGMGFVVAIFLASFCIGYLFKLFSVDIDALIRDAQENIPKLALVLGVMVFCMVIMLISYTFSVKALEKKEF